MAGPSKSAERSYLNRIIAGAALFRDAGEADIQELARTARLVAVPRGKEIAPPKGKDQEVYVIETGAVAELDRDPAAEKAVLVALLGPGEVAGLSAAAGDIPRADHGDGFELRALSNVTLVALPVEALLRILRRSDDLAAVFAATIAKAYRDLARRFASSLQTPLELRLAKFFSHLASIETGNRWEPSANIGRLQQTQLADMLGVSREHVNRTLVMWERSGLIIQTRGGDIVIENRKRLDQIAGARRKGEETPDSEWLWEVQSHLDHGLYEAAFDLAMEGVKRSPRDDRFKYFAALAIARMGSLHEAISLADSFKLSTDAANSDIASIGPRLRRDLAFASTPPDLALLAQAAEGYEAVFRVRKETYPGVNAASTHAMTGNLDRAREIAAAVSGLAEDASQPDDDEDHDYWRRATIAECRLIAGDTNGAAAAYAAAVNAPDAAPGMIGTTRKQLVRLKSCLPIDDAWIDRAAPQAGVLFFCGPLTPVGDGGRPQLDRLRRRFDDFLQTRRIAAAVGALAAGADIVLAEALLDAGVSLHAHLPVSPGEFISSSVEPSGVFWRDRYIACLERAQSIEWTRRTTRSRAAYRLGARIAMGRAIRQAEEIAGAASGFFALQRGRTPENSISCENAEIWRALGLDGEYFEDDWQAAPPAPKTGPAEHYFSALVIEGPVHDRLAADIGGAARFSAAAGSLTALAFDSTQDALAATGDALGADGAAQHRFWLDIGVVDDAAESGRSALPAALVSAACRPLTAPGKAFATEGFVNAAAATPGARRRFDYVGVTPTEERLDPCPLFGVNL